MENNYHTRAMNIKFIKEELERLSVIINGWDGTEQIAKLEQDIALDKLKSLYNEIKFASLTAESAAHVPETVIPPVTEESVPEQEEQEVEVEFIFDQEDFTFGIVPEIEEQSEEEQSKEVAALDDEEDFFGDDTPSIEPTTEIEYVPEPEEEEFDIEPEDIEEEVTEEEEEEELAEKEESITEPQAAEPALHSEPTVVIGNLFGGSDEVAKPTRTKHQRMMSIYTDVDDEPAPQELGVDISKIFELDITDEPTPITEEEIIITLDDEEELPTPADPIIKPKASDDKATILADVIAPTTPTIADSIEAPTALADEIEHASIRSLRDGIGINDKFLMIRDLFDGDSEEYEQMIRALDSIDDFDDCLIYITENYAWNPESEGAKFVMKLLERKLS